jgi:hypothetical protein
MKKCFFVWLCSMMFMSSLYAQDTIIWEVLKIGFKPLKKVLKIHSNLAKDIRDSGPVHIWDAITTNKAFSWAEFFAGGCLAYKYRSLLKWPLLQKAAAAIVIGNCIIPNWIKGISSRVPLVRRAIFSQLFTHTRAKMGLEILQENCIGEKGRRLASWGYGYN